MRHRRMMAAAALVIASVAARAEHFDYTINLHGTYSPGGADGCSPPLFDQPACPRDGFLAATLSFDTPTSADGAYLIQDTAGDITDFSINLGSLASDPLYGGVNLASGIPNGTVQTFDGSEYFSFDWLTRDASFVYDFGYPYGNGSFFGTMYAVPEPAPALLVLAGVATLLGIGVRRRRS